MPRCSACQEKRSPNDLVLDIEDNPVCKDCMDFNMSFNFSRKGVVVKGRWGAAELDYFHTWDEVRAGALNHFEVITEEVKNTAGNIFQLIKGGKE